MSQVLDELIALAADFNPITASLSPDTLAVFFYFEVAMQAMRTWLSPGNPLDTITSDEWDTIEAMVANAYKEIMTPMIGQIIEYVGSAFPPNILPCDGAAYDRVDYPDLYAVLDSAFIVDADTFVVPDLRDRVTIGQSATRDVGLVGGEEEHMLTVEELPAHDHSANDAGHVHAEIIAVDTLVNGGLEAPAPSATAAPSSTGLGYANISIGATGDDVSHNNMQPFLVLKKGIIAL